MKLLILSDIHGNLPALQAVFAQEKKIDGVVCLGDIVNYGPHPAQCVQWIQDHALDGWVVQGNHDHALGCNEDSRCLEPYRELAEVMQPITALELDFAAKSYLAELPPTVTHPIDGATLVLCHAAPSDPLYVYVPLEKDMRKWDDETVFAHHPDFLFVGHTHRGFVRQIGETTIVNPGSVGQPRDGDPRAAYAIWHDGIIELRRAHYDIRTVVHDLDLCAPERIARQLGRILLTGGDEGPEKRK